MDYVLLKNVSNDVFRLVYENINDGIQEGHFVPGIFNYLQSRYGDVSRVYYLNQAPVCIVSVAPYYFRKKMSDLEIIILTVFKQHRMNGIAKTIISSVSLELASVDVYARCMPASSLMMQVLEKQGFGELPPERTERGALSENRFYYRPACGD